MVTHRICPVNELTQYLSRGAESLEKPTPIGRSETWSGFCKREEMQVSTWARPTNSANSAPYARHAMAFVLCGVRGSRLMELTDWHAKPAVPFGGKSRIIDFALSNALNSGIRRIAVATQYKAHSLISHLQRAWSFFRPERNESFDILPASQRVSETMWYLGTADAVYQNIDIIESYAPQYMVILAGDHVYKMDYDASSACRVRRWRDGRLPGNVSRGGQTLQHDESRRK